MPFSVLPPIEWVASCGHSNQVRSDVGGFKVTCKTCGVNIWCPKRRTGKTRKAPRARSGSARAGVKPAAAAAAARVERVEPDAPASPVQQDPSVRQPVPVQPVSASPILVGQVAAERAQREARSVSSSRDRPLVLGRSADGTYRYSDRADGSQVNSTLCEPCFAAGAQRPATKRVDPRGYDGQQGINVCDSHSRGYPVDVQIVDTYQARPASMLPPGGQAAATVQPVPTRWDCRNCGLIVRVAVPPKTCTCERPEWVNWSSRVMRMTGGTAPGWRGQ